MKETIEVVRDDLIAAMSIAQHLAKNLAHIGEIDEEHCQEYYHQLAESLHSMLCPTPPMTESDWQQVTYGEFLVTHVKTGTLCKTNATWSTSALMEGGAYEVVRERGIRQPHFKGHPHPEGDVLVYAYHFSGRHTCCNAMSVHCWDRVSEYITL